MSPARARDFAPRFKAQIMYSLVSHGQAASGTLLMHTHMQSCLKTCCTLSFHAVPHRRLLTHNTQRQDADTRATKADLL